MERIWKIAIASGGLAAVGAFVFWSLYKEWLSLGIFSTLTSEQTFIIMLVFLGLVFLSLLALLFVYLRVDGENPATTNQSRSDLTEGEKHPYLVKGSQFFDKTALRFDLTIHNPTNSTKHLVKVGVRTFNTKGNFDCLSASFALTPIADYIIRFHVKEREHLEKADPILEIGPQGTVRFTITLKPNATGACGYWSTEVAAVAVFDDGTTIATDTKRIDQQALERLSSLSPSKEEILAALKHRDAGIRLEAIDHLKESKIDELTIKMILEAKLDDSDRYVRRRAIEGVGEFGLYSLSEKLLQSLVEKLDDLHESGQDDESGEISDIVEALGELRYSPAIDAMIAAHVNPYFKYAFSSREALVEMHHSEVPNKVRPLLDTYYTWTSEKAEKDLVHRYVGLCEIVVKYRDIESVPKLIELILNNDHEMVASNIFWEIKRLIPADEIVKDPFVLAFKPAFEGALYNPSRSARFYAIEFLCRLSDNEEARNEILEQGLKDEDEIVRGYTAELAGQLGAIGVIKTLEELEQAGGTKKKRKSDEIDKVGKALTLLNELASKGE